MTDPPPPLIFMIAGEPSGDGLGAGLMAELKRQTGGRVRFAGVGGPRMAAEGLASLFPMIDIALMGLFEVVARLPTVLRRINQTVTAARAMNPAAVVTIDSPDFSFRVARRLRRRAIKLIHYVAPTVWIWRPGRARAVARFLDHMLTILPFEPPYFERHGLASTFVGHAAAAEPVDPGLRESFRQRHAIAPETRVLAVLLGSRPGEMNRHAPIFGAAVGMLVQSHAFTVIAPALPHMEGQVRALTGNWPVPVRVIAEESQRLAAMAAADFALAVSGTVAVELANRGVPSVIAYTASRLTTILAGWMVRIKYVNLINIVLDAPVVPELIKENCNAPAIVKALGLLMDDPARARAQIEAVKPALVAMGKGGPPPSQRAAEVVLRVIGLAR